jgi:two-component system sensor histidine kinase FlrB
MKEAEREREAARSAMALAEVSAILAHEIRNPLASMELFAGLIAEEPEQTVEWVANLRAGIRLLSGTVNNVLSIHCGGSAPLAPLDLNACLRDGVEFVRPIAEQAGVAVTFAVAGKKLTGLMIEGNENGLRQIVLNLICNAIRYTQAGGTISVTARRAAGRAVVEIADSGCGIAPEAMGRLFEAGFSADGTSPGLGLAVCKRLMEQHGGEIRVTSRVNFGTTFELGFPTL